MWIDYRYFNRTEPTIPWTYHWFFFKGKYRGIAYEPIEDEL